MSTLSLFRSWRSTYKLLDFIYNPPSPFLSSLLMLRSRHELGHIYNNLPVNFRLTIDGFIALDSYAEQTGIDPTKSPFTDKLSNSSVLSLTYSRSSVRRISKWEPETGTFGQATSAMSFTCFPGFLARPISLVPFPPAKAIFVGINVLLSLLLASV
ncbi:hypothetical protein BJV78DRAFT_165086 [Lactifluus subvellereus]|nr:hypothetical protein BJV78DRAFT_165086 [Lactifluus subvellereus]